MPGTTNQLWRHTGQVVGCGAAMKTVTFAADLPIPDLTVAADRNYFVTKIRGLAALGAIRGEMTAYANTYLIEVSEDDGATWRAVIDNRTLYAGPPVPDPGPFTPDDVAGLRRAAGRLTDLEDNETRLLLVAVATKIAAQLDRHAPHLPLMQVYTFPRSVEPIT